MARVIVHQKNPWAAQAGSGGGLDPQRSDLWNIDLSQAVRGISRQLGLTVPSIASYFAQSLSFPEVKMKAEQFRRDSRPYNMPGFDDAPDPVKIVFILDSPGPGQSSTIYRFLDQWRQVTRAGRGAMSTERSIPLNADYRIDYAFNLNVFLLRGTKGAVTTYVNNRQAMEVGISNELARAATYTLVNAWLGGFKIGEVSHVDTKVLTIEATFYVEDVFDQNGATLLR